MGAGIFYFSNRESVPISGRKRFNCYGDGASSSLSEQQVRRVMYEIEMQGLRILPAHDPRTLLVKRVMARLIPVSGLEQYDWEIRVIDDPRKANAFILPGGKVFVYSGILPITRNRDGLAAVLGHEIAHNLAQHHGERMSASIGRNILLYSLSSLAAPIPGLVLLVQAMGGFVLDTVFDRPMSRNMESEADYIGLMLMAEACYDPREAVHFWRRMEKAVNAGDSAEIPEWMSTHPSHQSRVEKITEWLPKAMEKREMSDCQGTSGFAEHFQRALQSGVFYTG
ncbi:related to OMA1 - metalloendopeptidase of the mitochondrial inner membrane [Cephalotrichum gorgonifer]|uniref:Related to OMA1 - metalloendopeptidase of the mitochondrial inner membrane n=1 Tax=Cephalotrichum gorgonifer TaxID=2041049 RepID=A0AAE8N627_9PEZI|nr:related to OMA1 - metalloendopeptidase of the mitochondrial inner membrane [Cephalotrichum gorgonifer]